MNTLWDKAKTATREIAGKTNDAIETGKVKIEITATRHKLQRHYQILGRLTAESFEAGDTDLSLEREDIRRAMETIRRLRARIASLEASR